MLGLLVVQAYFIPYQLIATVLYGRQRIGVYDTLKPARFRSQKTNSLHKVWSVHRNKTLIKLRVLFPFYSLGPIFFKFLLSVGEKPFSLQSQILSRKHVGLLTMQIRRRIIAGVRTHLQFQMNVTHSFELNRYKSWFMFSSLKISFSLS